MHFFGTTAPPIEEGGPSFSFRFCGHPLHFRQDRLVAKLCPTLWLHELQRARLPCSSTVSQSVLKLRSTESVILSNHFIFCCPLLLLISIFPSIRLFFQWVGSLNQVAKDQSIGASDLASVLPMNIQSWFPLGMTDLISLLSKGLSRVFSSTTVWKHYFFGTEPSLQSNFTFVHELEKPWLWLHGPLLPKWCLCFLIHCLGLS